MRQYDDPVEVRRGRDGGPRPVPVAGRLWKVRAVRRALGGDRSRGGSPAGPTVGSDEPGPTAAVDGRHRPARRARAVAGGGRPRDPGRRHGRRAVLRRLRPLLRLGRRALAARRLRGLRAGDDLDDQPRPSTPPAARHHPLLPRAVRRVAARVDHGARRAHPLRLRPRRRAAGRGRPARGPGPARPRAGRRQKNAWVLLAEVAPELTEWARVLRRRRRQAGRRRGRLDPGGHRARGRRPGPRRRPVPRRGRAGARPGARTPRRRAASAGRRSSGLTRSSISTSPPATPCSTAPPTRTSLVERAAEHGDGHPRPHRPRRHLRRGQVRQARPPAGIRPVLGVDLAVAPTPWRPRAPSGEAGARGDVVPRCAVARPATARSRAAPGHLPGHGPGRLGGHLPDGLRDPPGRGARATRARRSTCWPPHLRGRRRARAARAGLGAGRGRHPAPRRPRPGGAGAVARGRAPREPGRRGWSPTGSAAGGGAWGPGTSAHAARMAGLARRPASATVLTNAVRYADRLDAPTVDVLDAARRLVPLDRRHVRRRATPRGSSSPASRCTRWPTRSAGSPGWATASRRRGGCSPARGRSPTGARSTRAPTSASARCTSRSSTLPDAGPHRTADALLRARCEAAIGWRYGTGPRMRVWKRLDDELETIRTLGYASYFLTVADVTDLIGEMGVRSCRARVRRRQPGQLPARRLRGRPDPPRPADGAVPVAAACLAARHRRRRGVRPARGGLPRDPRPLRRRAVRHASR